MRQLLVLFIVLLLADPSSAAQTFRVLCYHDIVDDLPDDLGADAYAVSTQNLLQQFNWLRENGYSVVSVDQVLSAQRGAQPLPEKAVVLTFDDGYASTYSRAFPLLKLFNYPAVVSLVGSWVDAGAIPVSNPDGSSTSQPTLTWSQAKEMADSGLIEIASHSHDAHRGIPANPQRNVQPAAVTRGFDGEGYESDRAYAARISGDLRRNSQLIASMTGKRPRTIAWPYGRYNGAIEGLARDLGMAVSMTLDTEPNELDASDHSWTRTLLLRNPKLKDFAQEMRAPVRWALPAGVTPQRVVQIDLDYVYDANAAQQEKNLDALIERVKRLGITTAYLQAFADPDGDGAARALYFPNRHLPMRADLFNRVAWQLQTRAGVKVFAWLPVLAFDLPQAAPDWYVQSSHASVKPGVYRRLSPFHPGARLVVTQIYQDLAKHANFAGLLFHDDATLDQSEDASAAALRVYREQWNLPGDVGAIKRDRDAYARWTQLKTKHLAHFTDELTQAARVYRKPLQTARNVYANVALDPQSERWFAQAYPVMLHHYDYVALMAMPYREGAAQPERWLRRLVGAVQCYPDGIRKTVFQVQALTWNRSGKHSPVPARSIASQLRTLQHAGAWHFGYYPENFINNEPDLSSIRPALSSQSYPYPQP